MKSEAVAHEVSVFYFALVAKKDGLIDREFVAQWCLMSQRAQFTLPHPSLRGAEKRFWF